MSTEDLVDWFKSKNGTLDTSSIGFANFAGQGRGAIALKDIPVRFASSEAGSKGN